MSANNPLPSGFVLAGLILLGLSASHAQNNQIDQRIAERFRSYDQNNDQAISPAEFEKGLTARNTRLSVGQTFREIDRDRDGELSLKEYAAAKEDRDEDRMRKGKRPPGPVPLPEPKPDPKPPVGHAPELVTRKNADGTESGSWTSELLGKEIACKVRYPEDQGASYPVVVYLKGLATPRLGKLDDKTLIRGFLEEGMVVIEADYEKNARAQGARLLPEIDDWYGFLAETQNYPVDTNWIYILPAGHTIDRKVRIIDLPEVTVDMDVFYPSGDAAPVPLMLQITSIKDQGFWINQRAYYIYGLLTNGYAGAVMEHNGGMMFSPKGDLFPERQAARLLRARADGWNLSGTLGVTGHSKGSSRAAKAAFLGDGEREGDRGPNAEQSGRFQAALLSAGQHATEFLIEDGYLDEVGQEKREAAEKQFAEMSLAEMLEISTTTYVTPDDPPAFLCVGELDKQFRVRQMMRLARKCREVGVDHRFVIQPDMPHQYIDDPAVIGRIFSFLAQHLK
ncbi:MAG: EF-hand domain-containing protein [Verrucomicrobiota bacterium]